MVEKNTLEMEDEVRKELDDNPALEEVIAPDDAMNTTDFSAEYDFLPAFEKTLDELRRHPYLDYYQARAIVDYRNTVGPIKNNTDLIKINLIDESTARKITPYIQYN